MRDLETVRREEAWVDNGEDGEHKELGGGGYRKAERPMSLCKSKTCFSRLILQMCTSCVPNPRCRRLWRVTSVMQTCPFSSPDPPLIKKVPPWPPLARPTKRKWNMSPWYVFHGARGDVRFSLPHPLGECTLCPCGHSW